MLEQTVEERFRSEMERYQVPFEAYRVRAREEDCVLKIENLTVLPLGIECVIEVKAGEREHQGVVSSFIIDFEEGHPIVFGMKRSIDDNKVKIVFPAASMGTCAWVMSEDEVQELEFHRR